MTIETMNIRIATTADSPIIALVHVEAWRVAYRGLMPDAVLNALDVGRHTASWQNRLAEFQGSVFVSEGGGKITGFCVLMSSRDKGVDPRSVAEIAAINILPAHWRTGIGRTICNCAIEAARRNGYKHLTHWVLALNCRARIFYEAMGFALDGATKSERASDGSELSEVRFHITL